MSFMPNNVPGDNAILPTTACPNNNPTVLGFQNSIRGGVQSERAVVASGIPA